MSKKVAVVAGAGPAGLTAALELCRRSEIVAKVFEADFQVGGISKTINYRGNRMDLGGHRFFSKSDWVMRWWQEMLPIDAGAFGTADLRLSYQNQSHDITCETTPRHEPQKALLVRQRLSRIFYKRRFFDYPLKLNTNTFANLGLLEMLRIGASYGAARLQRRSPEASLEDFLVNRFGSRLYRTFFKDYTEKVWGVPCAEISAEWGAQRIKSLSIGSAVLHTLKRSFRAMADPEQKATQTSLIERFLYPTLGPGQMWEEVAKRVSNQGGQISLGQRVIGIERKDFKVVAVNVLDRVSGEVRRIACDYLISTMPVCDIAAMLNTDDSNVARVASRLPYRDFMTAGLLLRRMNETHGARPSNRNGMPPDNWIYIQEPDVKIGRLQIFNNWSPALVDDPSTIWLGLEYFCDEGDDIWTKNNGAFLDFAAGELEKIGLIDRRDVLDGTVIRVPKAYPAYFGEYREFDVVRAWLERFSNMYSVGRNGMHRYNNQDHSMLAANCAVDSILDGGRSKSKIWNINTGDTHHEENAQASNSDVTKFVT